VSEANLFEVAVERDEGDPPGYDTGYARIGPLIGAERLGLSVYELPPGQSICPYHWEASDEEWLLVLSGRPTLRTPDGERELEPWDLAFFPATEEGAHKVTNRGDETLRVAILSTKNDPGLAFYPDSDKVGTWPPGKLLPLDAAVDYWYGETPEAGFSP
jgi:uncharacterized cupin superfamily protein